MTPKTTSMDALVLHAIGDARHERIERPAPEEGEALIRVGFCGVCGSDIPRVFEKGTYSFPLVVGHEFAGTIEALGPGMEDFDIGDRVAVFPLLWCGRCPACETGKYVMCHNYDYLGSRSNGAFAEFVVAPRANLMPVPANVSLEEASLTEPAAVALHAVKRAGGGPTIGETVVVFGAGPIGLMAAQWCRAMGAARVLIFDVVAAKLELARRLGFDDVFNSMDVDPDETVSRETQGHGAHVCIEAAGVPVTMRQAMAGARRGGRVVLMGNPAKDVSLPPNLISQCMRREVSIFGTWNSEYSATGNDNDWQAALDAMSSGTLRVKELITHRVGLERAFDALKMMKDQKEFYAKVLIEPGRDASSNG